MTGPVIGTFSDIVACGDGARDAPQRRGGASAG